MSFSSDRPVVAGAPWDGIKTANDRPEGFDPNENVTLETAVNLYSRGGADANDDTGTMGVIKEGYLADFQVYRSGIDPIKLPEPDEVYMHGVKR